MATLPDQKTIAVANCPYGDVFELDQKSITSGGTDKPLTFVKKYGCVGGCMLLQIPMKG